jgi:hypothetical protein
MMVGAEHGDADGTTVGADDDEHIHDAIVGVDDRDNGDEDAENESPGILLGNEPAMNAEMEADDTAGVLEENALTDDITFMTDAIAGDSEIP